MAFLLTEGQPAEHAAIPTLDRHIACPAAGWSRARSSSSSCTPTPPGSRAAGHAHPRHRLPGDPAPHPRPDPAGVPLPSLGRQPHGRHPGTADGRASCCATGWLVASLPLVYAGVLEDFWLPFRRYVEADAPARSTFFVVPFRERPGIGPRRPTSTRPRGAIRGVGDRRRAPGPRRRRATRSPSTASTPGATLNSGAPSSPSIQDAAGIERRRAYGCTGSTSMTAPSPQLEEAGLRATTPPSATTTPSASAPGPRRCSRRWGPSACSSCPSTSRTRRCCIRPACTCAPPRRLPPVRLSSPRCAEHGGVATISWHERSLSPERLWDDVYARVRGLLRGARADVRTGTRDCGVVPRPAQRLPGGRGLDIARARSRPASAEGRSRGPAGAHSPRRRPHRPRRDLRGPARRDPSTSEPVAS